MKRSPLPSRRTPLKRSQIALKRRGIKRVTPLRSRPKGTIPLTVREALVKRAKGRCERCKVSDRERRCDGHHKRLKSQGGKDTLANLAYLCRRCHDWAHGHRNAAAKEGWIIPTMRNKGRNSMGGNAVPSQARRSVAD